MCSNFEFLNLRLKKKDSELKIGKKVVKPILKLYGYHPPSCKNKSELDFYMRDQLRSLFKKSENGFSKSIDHHNFID